MYVCMYLCMYVCIYVCMYVCPYSKRSCTIASVRPSKQESLDGSRKLGHNPPPCKAMPSGICSHVGRFPKFYRNTCPSQVARVRVHDRDELLFRRSDFGNLLTELRRPSSDFARRQSQLLLKSTRHLPSVPEEPHLLGL